MAKLKMLKPTLPVLDTAVVKPLTGTGWRAGKSGANARGYNYRWQRAREVFLRAHPLCECSDCGAGVKRARAATVVDHRVAHRGDQALFWDESNWVAMAKPCHDAKTQREGKDG